MNNFIVRSMLRSELTLAVLNEQQPWRAWHIPHPIGDRYGETWTRIRGDIHVVNHGADIHSVQIRACNVSLAIRMSQTTIYWASRSAHTALVHVYHSAHSAIAWPTAQSFQPLPSHVLNEIIASKIFALPGNAYDASFLPLLPESNSSG